MTTIALTGGIASGKSTIASRLRELGAEILDADAFARLAVEPGTPGLRMLRERFGDAVANPDGTLDRAALADIIFRDPKEREAVNEILHPEIRRLTSLRLEAIRADDPSAIVVHDIPLLVEARHNYDYDEIWVAEAPAEVRVRRLMEDRDMDEAEARARVEAQASDEERRALADVLIDTTGTMEETLTRVEEEWARLQAGEAASAPEISYDAAPARPPREELAGE